MADKFLYRSGPKSLVEIPIASGTVVEIGDLVKLSSGKAVVMATSTDNLEFQGVASDAHYATDPSGTIGVYVPNPLTVFEYDLDAATDITFGDALAYSSSKKLTKNTTNPIATAVESKLQASNVLCALRLVHKTGNTDMVGDAS